MIRWLAMLLLVPQWVLAAPLAVAYGDDPAQVMDVYLPPNAKHAPILFMVHGGGWARGDKNARGVVANKAAYWLPKGYIFISANYRMLPDADPLVQAQDVARAIATVRQRAASWGGDGNKLTLMGHSAGAHLVALVAAQPMAPPVRGVVALDSGAYRVDEIMRFKGHWKLFDRAFGTDPAFWEAASPYHQLQAGAPPYLLVCSAKRYYSCYQARAFAKKGKEKQVAMQVLEQDLSHAAINSELGTPGAYTEAVDRFISALLQ